MFFSRMDYWVNGRMNGKTRLCFSIKISEIKSILSLNLNRMGILSLSVDELEQGSFFQLKIYSRTIIKQGA